MKRTLALLTIAAVAAIPASANAAAKKKPAPKPTKRTVTWSYSGIAGPSIAGAGLRLCAPAGASNCFDLPTEKYETNVAVSIQDATGQKVGLQYAIDNDYSGGATQLCAVGDVPVAKGSPVTFNTTADPTCGAPATSGTVTFTITGKK